MFFISHFLRLIIHKTLENSYTADDIATVLRPYVYSHPLSYVTLHLPVKEECISLIPWLSLEMWLGLTSWMKGNASEPLLSLGLKKSCMFHFYFWTSDVTWMRSKDSCFTFSLDLRMVTKGADFSTNVSEELSTAVSLGQSQAPLWSPPDISWCHKPSLTLECWGNKYTYCVLWRFVIVTQT